MSKELVLAKAIIDQELIGEIDTSGAIATHGSITYTCPYCEHEVNANDVNHNEKAISKINHSDDCVYKVAQQVVKEYEDKNEE